MGHCIDVYLMNKSEFRDEKIDSIIDGRELSKDSIHWVELKEGIMATTNIPNIREYGRGRTIAKITTDYFGGNGYQTAKLFIDNKKVYDMSDEYEYKEAPINSVLKKMGIQKKDGLDEFDTIGLSSYRHNPDFEKR